MAASERGTKAPLRKQYGFMVSSYHAGILLIKGFKTFFALLGSEVRKGAFSLHSHHAGTSYFLAHRPRKKIKSLYVGNKNSSVRHGHEGSPSTTFIQKWCWVY